MNLFNNYKMLWQKWYYIGDEQGPGEVGSMEMGCWRMGGGGGVLPPLTPGRSATVMVTE